MNKLILFGDKSCEENDDMLGLELSKAWSLDQQNHVTK